MTPELAALLKFIWSDVGIQMCAARSHEYKLFDSALYFLNDLERITHPEYLPTFNDILRCRIQTSGVVEMTYQFKVKTMSGTKKTICDTILLYHILSALK